jgi:AraC-like DNA-binding protein
MLCHHIAYMTKHADTPWMQAAATPVTELPELGYIGHAVFSCACHGLDEHDHGPALEVLVYRRGRQVFGVEKQRLVVEGDELVLFPPGIRHSSAHQPQARAEVYWLQIRLDLKRPFLGNRVHEPLRRQLLALARPEVRCAPAGLRDNLARLHELATCPLSPAAVSELGCRLGLFGHQLLAAPPKSARRRPSPALQRALRHMEEKVTEPLGLAEMTRIAGYAAESAFLAAFRDTLGMTPVHWFRQRKLERAAELLRDGTQSITAISLALGFCSTQHFATAFKRQHLLSPSQYRNAHIGALPQAPLKELRPLRIPTPFSCRRAGTGRR